jgi:hypothetical protein
MLASPPPERVVHPTWIEQTPKEDISISTKEDISISMLQDGIDGIAPKLPKGDT